MPVTDHPSRSWRARARLAPRIAALALAACAAGCATTGTTIRGTLAPPPPSGTAARGQVTAAARVDTTRLKEAVAYIVDDLEPVTARTPKPQPERVRQTRTGFVPRVAVVAAGTSVRFENADTVYHSVFSVAQSKRFDTGLFAPGTARTVVFDHPGLVKLYCSIHPRASGLVLVLPNRHFARLDAHGGFRLPPLRPGAYVVKVWHPTYGERSLHIRVPDDCRDPIRMAL